MQNGNNEIIINARIGRNGDLIANIYYAVQRIQLPVRESIIYVNREPINQEPESINDVNQEPINQEPQEPINHVNQEHVRYRYIRMRGRIHRERI